MTDAITHIYIDTLCKRLELTLQNGEKLEFRLENEAILADEFSIHEIINIRDRELKSWVSEIAHTQMGRTITREVDAKMGIDRR